MIRSGILALLTGMLLWQAAEVGAQPTNAAPEFSEVYGLVRDHLPGATDSDLNRAAVQALIAALSPKVALVTNAAGAGGSAGGLLGAPSIFDEEIAYLRVGGVEDGLAAEVGAAWATAAATNKLKGLVLDLRYAQGDDYAAAAATADLFVKKAQPLLNWGKGVVQSKAKTNAISLPVAVLVNHQTAGAAEALAAALRETGAGLLLGSPTAGAAAVTKDFPLRNGQSLRIATAAVQAGETSLLSAKGLKPDIAVEVSAPDERGYFSDPYKAAARQEAAGAALSGTNLAGGTNRPARRPRFNEAELVRERREGGSPDAEAAEARSAEPEKPLVRDPALARALDLLKGLAVVRPAAAP
jgi:hypothetical protein